MGPWEARSTLGQFHEEQTSLPALVLKGKSRDFQELLCTTEDAYELTRITKAYHELVGSAMNC